MSLCISRRQAMAGIASASLVGLSGNGIARADKPMLTAVEWGGKTFEAMREIQSMQDLATVRWVQHAGGAAAIVAKIAANKPRVDYDVVAAWSPVFVTMLEKDWLETVTVKEMPNLADVPESLFLKDAAGNLKNVPRDTNVQLWGYLENKAPFPIKRIDDLLDRRLAGQICFPGPVMYTCMQIVSLAYGLGGSERDMTRAWDFLTKLAKSGNIGRVATSDVEISNSLTSSETSIAFAAASIFLNASEHFPIHLLAKEPENSGFKSAVAVEGWCIMKGGNTELAKRWVNAMMAPAANESFGKLSDHTPTNQKSKPSASLAPVTFTGEELKRHAYIPDWAFIATQLPSWTRKWEQEIAPLL